MNIFLGLDNRYLSTLACQAMFVQRIPKDLEILITRKSDKFVLHIFLQSNKFLKKIAEVIHKMSFNYYQIYYPIK